MSRRMVVCLGFFLLSVAALSQRLPSQPLEPTTYRSSSGQTALYINPSAPDGSGPAFYRASRRGKVLWERRLPFTLCRAGISDSGVSGGYGHSSGPDELGELLVVIVDSKGKIRLKESKKRRFPNTPDAAPRPDFEGLIFDPDHGQMIVRVFNGWNADGAEPWWRYSLSLGKYVQNITVHPSPEDKDLHAQLSSAETVKGTPLTLLDWECSDTDKDELGQTFTLIDKDQKVVWRHYLSADFENGVKGDERYDLRESALAKGTILNTNAPNRFEIRFVKKNQRVTFEVRKSATDWKVAEISRKPYVEPSSATPQFRAKPVQLRLTKTLTIPETGAGSAIHDLGPFQFWGNRIVFVREGEKPALCVVEASGALVRTIPLPDSKSVESFLYSLAKTSGSRFLLSESAQDKSGVVHVWIIDVSSGLLAALPKINATKITAIAGFPDGSFAAIGDLPLNTDAANHLSLYDPTGKMVWTRYESDSQGPADISMPEDLDINSEGQIVVLEGIDKRIQFFDRTGKLVRGFGFAANYPSNVSALSNGQIMVNDFQGARSCLLFNSSGKMLQAFNLSFPNGKILNPFLPLKMDASGNLWAANFKSISRIDSKGTVVQTVGEQIQQSTIWKVEDLRVGLNGNVYALDSATSSVHVFDPSGRQLFVCSPQPKEFEDPPTRQELAIAHSGDIYIFGARNNRILHYSRSGLRLGYLPFSRVLNYESYAEKPPLQLLLEPRGAAIYKMLRWPDQLWMEGPNAMAPDGRLMAYSAPNGMPPPYGPIRPGPYKLAFFDASTKPERMVSLPPEMPEVMGCAFDGRTSYFVTEKGLLAVDRNGKFLWVFKPSGWSENWEVFISKGGLALYDGEHTVRWYKPSAH